MPDASRHARIRDDRGREHGVRGREQRAEEERLRPVEVGQRVRGDGDEPRGDVASRRRACAAAGATPPGAARPRPRARPGTGSGSTRRSPARARSPTRGRTPAPRPRPRRGRTRPARRARSATGSCASRAPTAVRRRTRSPPSTATATSNVWKSCTRIIFARDGVVGHPRPSESSRTSPRFCAATARRASSRSTSRRARRSTITRCTSAPTSWSWTARSRSSTRAARRQAGQGFVAHFDPKERHEVRAKADSRLVLFLAPWPGEGHPSQR